MIKKIIFTVLALLVLVGGIIGVKALQIVSLIKMGKTLKCLSRPW
jgi:hypothetical protein